MIPIYTPRIFTGSAVKALESGWISSQGEFIEKARRTLSDLFNGINVVLTNNGTTATHMLIKSLKYKYPNIKKIYVPNHVFIAVWNVILYEFSKEIMEVMEMDPTTLNMRTDDEYIMGLEYGAAVMIVHNVGNIINVPRLKRLRPDLIFIEDNCEGLFGKYEGQYSGTSEASLCSAVSFFANKTITAGEGGAFFTHDKDLYDYIYRSIHHGLSGKKYVYDMLGYNCRMTNIQAGLLYDQLINLSTIISDKERVFNHYRNALNKHVILPRIEEGSTHANWMFCCGIAGEYQDFEEFMKQKGIDVRPFFYDIQVHTHLSDVHRPKGSIISSTFAMLPSYPDLETEKVQYICDAVLTYLQTHT